MQQKHFEEEKREIIKVYLSEDKKQFWEIPIGKNDKVQKLKENFLLKEMVLKEDYSFYLIFSTHKKDKPGQIYRRKLSEFDSPLIELSISNKIQM